MIQLYDIWAINNSACHKDTKTQRYYFYFLIRALVSWWPDEKSFVMKSAQERSQIYEMDHWSVLT